MYPFLLVSGPVADWISSTFPIIQTILIIAITLFALAIIITVLLIPSNPQGGRNVILGTSNESYYAANKGYTKEGRLKRTIIISAICIFVLTILYFVSFGIYSGI